MPPWLVPVIFIVVFVLVFALIAWAQAKRRAQLTAQLGSMGFATVVTRKPGDHAQAWSDVATPEEWSRSGERGVRWSATGQVQGLTIVAFEHTYHTGAGKNRRMHWHTVASASGIRGLPRMVVRKRTFGDSVSKLFRSTSIATGDEVFDKAFHTQGEDHDAIVHCLTPALRAWLLAQPKRRYGLVTGPTSLAVVYAGVMSPQQLAELVVAPGGVLSALARDAEHTGTHA